RGERMQFFDCREAKHLLLELLGDYMNATVLRDLAAHELHGFDRLDGVDRFELATSLARAIVSERLIHVVRFRDSLARVRTPDEAPEAVPVPAATLGTFDLSVVVDCDGTPVRQLSLRVKTQGESELRPKRTDGNGLIHIDYVVRGAVEIASDVQGARLDQSAVVVGWGGETIDRENVGSRLGSSQIRYLLEIEQYRVHDGDTLESIASKAGITWQDLAFFNWGTKLPEEINEHLAAEVGCTKKTADGKNYVFTSSDMPGLVSIPRPFSAGGLPTGTRHVLRVKPAESELVTYRVRLCDPFNKPMPHAPYKVTVGKQVMEGEADDAGWLALRCAPEEETCIVEWGESEEADESLAEDGEQEPDVAADSETDPTAETSDYAYKLELYLDLQEDDPEKATERRLHNLGLNWSTETEDNLESVRFAYHWNEKSPEEIQEELRRWHDEGGDCPPASK
ncbi:MAG TPA: LysM domain-containing protein, partial [Anaeromyxobacteraceae bacterium]|nr:LysM domain-containing protein [Anaeromyxobacteraceae bacterium]